MRQYFRADQTRPDGTPVLEARVWMPFTLDQAARSLAVVYGDQPMRTGIAKLLDGLRHAEEIGVAAQVRTGTLVVPPPAAAVAAYRGRLTTPPQVLFPQGKLRVRMLAEREAAHAQWRNTPAEQRPTRPRAAGHPQTWAHDTNENGEPAVRIQVSRWFTLDEAALALAAVHDPSIIPRATKDAVPRQERILQELLGNAAKANVLADTPEVGPELVAAYRTVLLEQGVFRTPTR